MLRRISLVLLLGLFACGGDDDGVLDAGRSDTGTDASAGEDAAVGEDADVSEGAGTADDAGDGQDGGNQDGGNQDGGNQDAAVDAGTDAGPRMLGDGRCRSETDCEGRLGDRCLEPGGFLGCGICRMPDPSEVCTDDSMCDGRVCERDPRDCFCGGESTCRAGCSADSCEVGEECMPDGHCGPASCDGVAECPSQFDCVEGGCVRFRCEGDGDCPGEGWCVRGACYDEPGSCTPLPA